MNIYVIFVNSLGYVSAFNDLPDETKVYYTLYSGEALKFSSKALVSLICKRAKLKNYRIVKVA